ncbi:hypothetical protein I317_02845 [Kwoniella heveanensis CBS 569]|nr:hypothetical protein I317_02845 [Kwoniella heveanensis CBS 569]
MATTPPSSDIGRLSALSALALTDPSTDTLDDRAPFSSITYRVVPHLELPSEHSQDPSTRYDIRRQTRGHGGEVLSEDPMYLFAQPLGVRLDRKTARFDESMLSEGCLPSERYVDNAKRLIQEVDKMSVGLRNKYIKAQDDMTSAETSLQTAVQKGKNRARVDSCKRAVQDAKTDFIGYASSTLALNEIANTLVTDLSEGCKQVCEIYTEGRDKFFESQETILELAAESSAVGLQDRYDRFIPTYIDGVAYEVLHRDAQAQYDLAKYLHNHESTVTKNAAVPSEEALTDAKRERDQLMAMFRKDYQEAYGSNSEIPSSAREFQAGWHSDRFKPGQVRPVWSLVHPEGCRTKAALRLTCEYTMDGMTWNEVMLPDGSLMSAARKTHPDDIPFAKDQLELDLRGVYTEGTCQLAAATLLQSVNDINEALHVDGEAVGTRLDFSLDPHRLKGEHEVSTIADRVTDAALASAHELAKISVEWCDEVIDAQRQRCDALLNYAIESRANWRDPHSARSFRDYLIGVDALSRVESAKVSADAREAAVKVLVDCEDEEDGGKDGENPESTQKQKQKTIDTLKAEAGDRRDYWALTEAQARSERDTYVRRFTQEYDRQVPSSMLEWVSFLGPQVSEADDQLGGATTELESEGGFSLSEVGIAEDRDMKKSNEQSEDGSRSSVSGASSFRSVVSNSMPAEMAGRLAPSEGTEGSSFTFSRGLLRPVK